MSERNGSNGSTEALREEIRQTRAELGETVQALAAKADVKRRLRQSAARTSDRWKGSAMQTAKKVKDSATLTAGKLKESAAQATDRARVSMYHARDLARHSPIPWFAAAGTAAVLAVILGIRGRRR